MRLGRFYAIALCVVALAACGGGGGGGSGRGTDTTLNIGANSVGASASYWDVAPVKEIVLSVTNMPSTGVYVAGDFSGNGIASLDVVEQSSTEARLIVQFHTPSMLAEGTYSDEILLRVCHDEQCSRQVRNSPARISTSYVVTAANAGVTASNQSIAISASRLTPTQPAESVELNITNPGPVAPYISTSYIGSPYIVQSLDAVTESTSRTRLDLTFSWSDQLNAGTYTQDVQVNVCYDSTCQRHLQGSPLTIATTYTVNADPQPEPGLDPVPVLNRVTLTHDVVDAEYSSALDAIVMVSSYPSNALYVYDAIGGSERHALLVKTPTSVSVSPDGLSAAVGHDALISVVDLTTAGLSGAAEPLRLTTSADAFDVVLDGRGYVHVTPRVNQWVSVHSVAIATGIESLSNGFIYAGTRMRLHPSGDFIYGADNGLSPSDIEKYDIAAGPAMYLYDSPYHGDYGMCGNLWFKQNGTTIYTRCGNTFRASTVPSQDMIYSGRLDLSTSEYYSYNIESLSQSDDVAEVVLIEAEYYDCTYGDSAACFTHLALYESDFLQRTTVWSIPPMTVAGINYAQRGLFVFHSANGQRVFMLSRLSGMPNPDAEYYITVVR